MLRTCGLMFLFVLALSAADPNRLTDAERRNGWRLLFDGSTTAGWQEITGKPFPANCWTVEEGALKAIPRTDGFQDIRTAATFRNFELQFDWKLAPGGNSGVKYLIQKIDEWKNAAGRQARARGFEYQLADPVNPDVGGDPRRSTASLYSLIAPAPATEPRLGEFHHSLLIVRGGHVEHWLDGVKVVEFETDRADVQKLRRTYLPKGAFTAESPISLQNHGTEAWFRNLKVRALPD
jgi:Domain of Unknown Function (DUF1080)